MKIDFENRSSEVYTEIYHQTKRVQETAESVVPDTDEDIGKIISVQSSVSLKSKDITGRGVMISGEASAAVLYITEGQDKVSFVRLSRGFTMEYEIADIPADAAAQVLLRVVNAESRIINPRKVSVSFEIAGELSCYKKESVVTDTALPETELKLLNAKYENKEIMMNDSVSEKTFAISEQFAFQAGKPSPCRLISEKTVFNIHDTQLIGTKVITKGEVEISVCYLSDEVCYPVKTEFTTPFSQITDIGSENMDVCSAHVELTSSYFNLTDTVNGEKMLDTEIHAVLQTVSRSRKNIGYIADAYSNRMPAKCEMCAQEYNTVSESLRIKLSGDEKTEVMGDCVDVLSVMLSTPNIMFSQGKISATLNLDILYRTATGELASVRRGISMETECAAEEIRIIGSRITDELLRPEGQYIDTHITLEVSALTVKGLQMQRVESVELDEDGTFDLGEYPSVTLVKAEDETLWELAKQYHSSIEEIERLNELDGEMKDKFILIPKVI